MTELSKQYEPIRWEEDIYKLWEDSGALSPNADALAAGKKPFVMALPPPNITGNLHMGHALQDTIMDILARFHRLQGEPVLWLPGTDSAAIATNRIIETQLASEGKTRHDIGREDFLQRVDDWYAKTGAAILNQMKRLGCSCDWSRNRFTLDKKYIAAVNEAFIKYFERGYIYRGARLVNWDPSTQTTVSDLEIDWTTQKTVFYTLQYGPFLIGTARPETKFGDKYVVMHPDDSRYEQYKHGDKFTAEWINGPVTATIIKDAAVDPDFGTGVMTITPWHDATDFAIAQRHQLDMEQIIDFTGKLMPIAGEFSGQSIEQARPKIVQQLEQKGLLVNIDKKYKHNVALNDRGKGAIEPQVMRQWFVDMDKLRAETMAVVNQDIIRFVPPRWKKHFLTWMENVHDWNINRQIWLGHRLPVWWKKGTHGSDHEEGNYVVSLDKPEGLAGKPTVAEAIAGRRPAEAEGVGWEQDPDVLDTWFSSALWPFAALGWPEQTADLQQFYPTTVLVTARDILHLWVARMIFSGLDLMQGEKYGERQQEDRIPFKDVFIHPTVLAKDGRRMSKSLGTGVDPLELIGQYGADATRFGLMMQLTFDNQAIKFSEQDVVAARNFANKIWNIARYLETAASPTDSNGKDDGAALADKWITQRHQKAHAAVTVLLSKYKIGEAAQTIYDFIWHDLADWYLEILKVNASPSAARQVFKNTLITLHPFMPFLTEVLWREMFKEKKLLMVASWPKFSTEIDDAVAGDMAYFQDMVTTIRSARMLLAIPAKAEIKVFAEKFILPDALSKLTRASLVREYITGMKQFPTKAGQVVSIYSEHITAKSLAAAATKMAVQERELAAFIEQQADILVKMSGKAQGAAIAQKETDLRQARVRLAELQAAAQALAKY